MKIERRGKPDKPEKGKPLSEHEITVALGEEKIPDKKTVLNKMGTSRKKEEIRKAVSHSILLNKLTDTPGHEH